jgi:predicted 3-demethylubiquinone-9 3-methyltransferase (glyoxalase superfamily)
MKKITPCLWFDNQAEEAVNFYASIFENSKIRGMARYTEAGPGPEGSVMTVSFELNGYDFLAINGGPQFQFSPAVSFVVNCETQEEVDNFWEKLSEGGQQQQCWWVQDKYGVSWQITPIILGKLMSDPSPRKAQSVMQAMLKMTKLDIGELEKAYQMG